VVKKREIIYLLLGITAFVALALLAYRVMMVNSHQSLDIKNMSSGEAALTVLLLGFLAIVTIRHLVLVVWSFSEHVDQENTDLRVPSRTPQSEAALPFITIIVPAYNEAKVIVGSIQSLFDLDYPKYEVIVVDDGSTDTTYQLVRGLVGQSDRCILRVFSKPNAGKANALNFALTQARGELIVAMDADTALDPQALREMQPHFADPRIGAVAGCVRVINRENMLTWLQALEFVHGLAFVRMGQGFVRLITVVPGPLGMFRKSAIMALGAYENDTFAEDTDLSLKLLMHGWHIPYEPRAVAWSESPSRLLDLLKQRYRWSRGVLQAVAKQWHWMRSPAKSRINFFVLWYTWFEATAWPITNVLAHVFFVYLGLQHGISVFIFYWFAQLLLLDLVVSIYAVLFEREDPRLIWMTPFLRLFYGLLLDVAKVFATVEQWMGVPMTWGKLEREGKV
jgi:poly-beta-1,6-N-acetyl-D-glucosamine synthase